jgi:hypothetical protein
MPPNGCHPGLDPGSISNEAATRLTRGHALRIRPAMTRRNPYFAVYVNFLTYTLKFLKKLTSILTFGSLGIHQQQKTPQKDRKQAILGA